MIYRTTRKSLMLLEMLMLKTFNYVEFNIQLLILISGNVLLKTCKFGIFVYIHLVFTRLSLYNAHKTRILCFKKSIKISLMSSNLIPYKYTFIYILNGNVIILD